MKDITVSLLQSPVIGRNVLASIASLTFVNSPLDVLSSNMESLKAQSLLDNILDMDHQSITEHYNFTFVLSGISRVALAQITRHRIASYTSKSQQYQDHSGFPYITPPGITELKADQAYLVRKFEAHMHAADSLYRELMAAGVDKDEARYVLPNACKVDLVVTMNTRSLYNFFKQRICKRNTREVQSIAIAMFSCLIEAGFSWLFHKAGPACVSKGKCDQKHFCCGKPFVKLTKEKGGGSGKGRCDQDS